jgi:ADP-heptose:LPS heptosyltransferase
MGTAGAGLVPGVRRIAVLRANGLGDLLMTLPAFEALRAAYPHAEIVLLGRRWHRRLLEDRPGPIDRVIELPPIRGVSAPEDGGAPASPPDGLLEALRSERFDLAVQLHGGGRHSNPFVRELGAGVTAGGRAADAGPLDRWVRYDLMQPELLRAIEVVALAGARPVTLEPCLDVTDADMAASLAAVPVAPGPLVAVHPGASDARRRWPAERFAAVADALAVAGATVVLTGDAAEAELVERVGAAMRRPALPLAGRLDLGGLAGLLSRCALVVGNDTGPLHLARAVGAATVAVYWIGNLANAGPATRRRHRAPVSWTLACPVCGASTTDGRCPHDESFVSSVGVDEVLGPALELLTETMTTL